MKKKVYFFTNIIPPYRIFLFNELEKSRQNTNFDFEVFFMRKTESNREWAIDLLDIKFKYLIGNGLYFEMKNFYVHFNPMLIYRLIISGDEIILGASWNNPNILILALFKRLGLIKNTLSVWSEANYLTNESRTVNRFRDYLKKWFFKSIDGKFILPGEMAVKSFEHWGIRTQKITILPNLVSSVVFKKKPLELRNAKNPQFLLVARLEENVKGIQNFMISVGIQNLRKIDLRIAGTGQNFEDYKHFINIHNLSKNVFLLGNLTQEEISIEYRSADVFILPSYSDPSPLTVVEALSSGLPLLLSNRCGNHFEAVSPGKNGYTFDPENPSDIKNKLEKMLSEQYKWSDYSIKSMEIASEKFNPTLVIKAFLNSYNC